MFDREKSTPIEQETYNFLHCVCVFFLVYAYRSCLSGRKKPPRTLLGSSFGDLEIKLTKDRLARRKTDFNHVRMEFTKKCDSKKQLEFGAYIPSVDDEKFYGN